MPVHAWIDPQTAEEIPLDEGPARFEAAGILPAEATQMMLNDIRGERADDDPRYLNPSKLYPGLNCRREIVLQRFLDYTLDPRALWAALEGTMWHIAFANATAGEGWTCNVRLPNPDIAGPQAKLCEDGRYRLEVYPGVWLKGTADRVRNDYGALIDHKTTRPPYFPKNGVPKDYAFDSGDRPGQVTEWAPQINTYAYMVEMTTGTLPEELWAWRLYRGCSDSKYTFRKLRIPLWPREKVWEGIKDYATSLLEMLNTCWNIVEEMKVREPERVAEFVRGYVKASVPMDGYNKQMLNNHKCTEYCALRPICFGIEGLADF